MTVGCRFDEFCVLELGFAPGHVRQKLEGWLHEDFGSGDITLRGLGDGAAGVCRAELVAKQDCTLAGVELASEVFRLAHGLPGNAAAYKVLRAASDGQQLARGDVVLEMEGLAGSLLLAERTALNLLARLCGVATQTRVFANRLAEAAKKQGCQAPRLLETRKTTPGLRSFEKFATRMGGASNHRMNLDTGAMLKENHFRAASVQGLSFVETITAVKDRLPLLAGLEVEVTSLEEFSVALRANVAVIMLDNFLQEDMQMAVDMRNGSGSASKIEISGNLDRLPAEEIAKTGADYVSMGALVHGAIWSDLSLRFLPDHKKPRGASQDTF